MKNREIQRLLAKYPDEIDVRLLPKQSPNPNTIIDLTEENILVTSEGAYVDTETDPEKWDHEDGKIRHKGKKFLLINPIIY